MPQGSMYIRRIMVIKKASKGYLHIKHPEIFKELDTAKYNEDPKLLKAGSTKKVSWLCPSGHSYECAVGSRTRKSAGCQECKSVLYLYPEIFKELDLAKYIAKYNGDPKLLKVGSNKKVAWKDPEGRTYECPVSSRVRQYRHMPYDVAADLVALRSTLKLIAEGLGGDPGVLADACLKGLKVNA